MKQELDSFEITSDSAEAHNEKIDNIRFGLPEDQYAIFRGHLHDDDPTKYVSTVKIFSE